jgi:hypothetical protein
MHTPPGSQRDSRRAAMLTPSPKMSSPSTIMSPMLTPMRKTMRFASVTSALRATMPRWITTAQPTASTTLANSTSAPSPVVLTMRPRWVAIAGSMSARRWAFSAPNVPTSSTLISRLYPTISEARMAASRRWMESLESLCKGPPPIVWADGLGQESSPRRRALCRSRERNRSFLRVFPGVG